MSYGARRDKIIWVCVAIAAAGAALLLAPAPQRTIETFPPASPAALDPAASNDAPTDLTRLSPMFDLSGLPAVPPPILPPPDPSAELKRFRFAGAASGGERVSALFEAGGDVRALKTGEALAGFILTRIESDHAVFVKDDLEVVLPLTPE